MLVVGADENEYDKLEEDFSKNKEFLSMRPPEPDSFATKINSRYQRIRSAFSPSQNQA
jgi:hypothetical protein